MNEWRRLMSDRRRRVLLLCIPILCLLLFCYQKCDGKFDHLFTDAQEYRALLDTYDGKSVDEIVAAFEGNYSLTAHEQRLLEQAKYLQGYADYLQRVQTQAQKMQQSSLFGSNKNSFTYRNIIKTAQDFADVTAEHISLGNDRAMQDWLAFSAADWIFLAAVLILVMSFFEDRQKSLSAIVRACPAGRSRLQLSRLGILVCFSAAMTVMLYAVPLAVSLLIDGGWDGLDRPVQSLAEFQKCTEVIQISSFLPRYFAMKAACGILLGALFWFMLSFLEQIQLCWAATAGALAMEYLLYTLIPTQSVLSPLREINVFSYVFTAELYTKYENINFVGFPVGRSTFLSGLLAVAVLALGAWIVFMAARRYPFGNRDLLGKWLHMWNRLGDAMRRRLGLYGLEWYKLLFLTAGGIFLAFSFFFTKDMRHNSSGYFRAEDTAYRQYVAQVQGPVTQDTYTYIHDARAALEAKDMQNSAFSNALDRLEKTLADLDDGAWIVDDVPFMNYYGEKADYLLQKNGVIALLCLTLCLSPLFSCEENGDVRKVLKAASGGRERLFRCKYLLALGVTLLVWLMTTGREWRAAAAYFGNVLTAAPCSSVPLLRQYGNMTVGGFLALLYLSRLVVLLTPMHLCIFIAERSSGFEKTFLQSGLLLAVPAVVVFLGGSALTRFTPMTLLSCENPLLSGTGGTVQFAVWSGISVPAVIAAKRHWCRPT